MLDHVSFAVLDFDKSLTFYDETFKILGYTREITFEHQGVRAAGYGRGTPRPHFWISSGGNPQETVGHAQGVHYAFRAPSQEAVDAWYAKALELGATDNGQPGPRSYYHSGYYGAFIIDPNGWRLEACLHTYQNPE